MRCSSARCRVSCVFVFVFAAVFSITAHAADVSHPREYAISVSQFVRHPALDALLNGFRDYLKGTEIPVSYKVHIANGDPALNSDIAHRIDSENPDLILAISTPSSQACAEIIHDKTILFSAVTDPVGASLVDGIDKPGAHITGMTDMSPVARQIGLMMALVPNLKTLGVIYNPDESNSLSLIEITKEVCAKQGIKLLEKTVKDRDGVALAAQSLIGKCDAVYVPADNTVVSVMEEVARICGKNRVPLFAGDVDSIPRGAIATLAIDYYSMGRQTGRMAERILKGGQPSSMPVESLQDFRIHVNTKAAELMGVELPVDLLQAADVIYDSFPD